MEFEYQLESYFAIVRTKTNKGEKHYHITIMNGNLERMLYGNHIFIEADGVLHREHILQKWK